MQSLAVRALGTAVSGTLVKVSEQPVHVFSAGPGEVALRLVRVPAPPTPPESERFFYVRPGVDYLIPLYAIREAGERWTPPCRLRVEVVSVEPAGAQVRVSVDFRPECALPGAPTVLSADALMSRAEVEAVRDAVVQGGETSGGYFGGRGPFRWAGECTDIRGSAFCASSPGISAGLINVATSADSPLPRNPELSARVQTGSPLVAAAAALARSQCELDIRGGSGRAGPLPPEI